MDGAKRDLLAFVLPASKAAESLATTAPAKAAAEAAIAASMTPPVVPRKDELVPGGKIGREVAANFSSFVIDFDDLALDIGGVNPQWGKPSQLWHWVWLHFCWPTFWPHCILYRTYMGGEAPPIRTIQNTM